MDIKEFTEKFVVEKLREICHDNDFCIMCPFYCKSATSINNCKLVQLDENLLKRGEEMIWTG